MNKGEAKAQPKKKSQNNNKTQTLAALIRKHWKIFLAFVAVVLVIYFAGAIYFSGHFSPKTMLNGHEVGGMTAAEVKILVEEDLDAHTLLLKERNDKTEEIKAASIDMEVSLGDSVSEALEGQNQFLWFFPFFRDMEVALHPDVKYNDTKLEAVIDGLNAMQKDNMEKPVNTKIELKDGEFVVIPEVYGTTIQKKKLLKAVKEALDASVTEINLEEKGCYKNPKYYADGKEVEEALAHIEKLRKVVVTYDFKYTTEILDKTRIDEWIELDKDLKVSLTYDEVLDYIEELADKYDTYATVRDFTTSYGRDIQILYGSYGWKISQHKETQALIDVIEKGESVKREPEYMYRAVCRKEGNIDWDDTYAEVSIASQRMWFYKDGECVLTSSIVTGDVVRPNRKTPTGAYAIMFKKRDTSLVGQNYESPVRYWMPFTTDVGFHDADWRNSFGGSIYKGNGSHGCVNMPIYAARQLYELIEVGCPVFVY